MTVKKKYISYIITLAMVFVLLCSNAHSTFAQGNHNKPSLSWKEDTPKELKLTKQYELYNYIDDPEGLLYQTDNSRDSGVKFKVMKSTSDKNREVAKSNSKSFDLLETLSPGKVTIRTYWKDDETVYDDFTFTVTGTALESFSLESDKVLLHVGESYTFSPTYSPENANNKVLTFSCIQDGKNILEETDLSKYSLVFGNPLNSKEIYQITPEAPLKITGQNLGTSVITFTSKDGAIKKQVEVSVVENKEDIKDDDTEDNNGTEQTQNTGDNEQEQSTENTNPSNTGDQTKTIIFIIIGVLALLVIVFIFIKKFKETKK